MKIYVWFITTMLTALLAVGMGSCSKEDIPTPPPGIPDNPDKSDKNYKPVNKLSQVFKNGYLKKRTIFATTTLASNSEIVEKNHEPIEEEYIVDDNNNLAKVVENDKDRALFEYGLFTDPMGNEYQVKFTYIDDKGRETVSLCKLNEDEMVEDRYISDGTGKFYEYQDGHIVKITGYNVVDGQKVVADVEANYEWNQETLTKYNSWELEYPAPDYMIENRGCFFAVLYPDLFPDTEAYLYMAALMGQPSKYLPSQYNRLPSWMNEIYRVEEWNSLVNGLPQSVKLRYIFSQSSHGRGTLYQIEYKWR